MTLKFKNYKVNDLKRIFLKIKFKEKICIIHSDFFTFREFNLKPKKFLNLLINLIGKNKTYVFPVFSWENGKSWHLKSTISNSGVLSEYARKNIPNVRSISPIHSVCIIGPQKNLIPTHYSKTSFGKGSTWEWLISNKDVMNLSLGIGIDGGATFLHVAEEMSQVNYRFYKPININIYNQYNEKVASKFYYFARRKKINNSWVKCEKDLIKDKILRIIKNKFEIPILLMKPNIAINFINKKLKKNQKYLIKD